MRSSAGCRSVTVVRSLSAILTGPNCVRKACVLSENVSHLVLIKNSQLGWWLYAFSPHKQETEASEAT